MKRRTRAAIRALSAACAGLALAGYVAQAAGQTVTITPQKGDDFRAVYAGAADIAEGKDVAEASCAVCHGLEGRSATPGIPHIAGQRAAYVYVELNAYKVGRRTNEAMARAVKFLSDDALVLRRNRSPIRKSHLDIRGTINDMVIGHNVTLRIIHETGPGGLAELLPVR